MERLLASQLSQGPLVQLPVANPHPKGLPPSGPTVSTARTYVPIHQAGAVQPMATPKPRGRAAQRACARQPLMAPARATVTCAGRALQHERW